jgi:hypothetical protein
VVHTLSNRSQSCLAVLVIASVFCLALGASVVGEEASSQTEGAGKAAPIIVTECPIALDPKGAGPCRIVVYQLTDRTWEPIPQRVVVYDSEGQAIWEAYRDDAYLEKVKLLQYFRVTNIVAADIDTDGVDEAVLTWECESSGSGWIQTLEILDYDAAVGAVISHRGERVAGPFGGFEVLPLDDAGSIWRVIGYSFQTEDRTSRIGDLECRWCPHRYRVAAYTTSSDGLAVDSHWNGGQVAYTQLRFDCEAYATLAVSYAHSSLFNALAADPPFVLLSPTANQTISLGFPLRVEFASDMPRIGVRVLGSTAGGGEELLLDDVLDGTASVVSTSLKAEDYLYYLPPSQSSGRIVLYDPRNADNPETTMSITIEFAQEDTVAIEVFFPNRDIPSPTLGEESVYPVRRAVQVDSDIARAALEMLFRGPTGTEKAAGYFTYLVPECSAQDFHYPEHPCSDKVAGLDVADGIAQVVLYDVDWWWGIIWQLGGIVGLETALEQVRATLLPLPGIERVVIW